MCWLHPPLPDPALELLLHLNIQSQEDSHSTLSHTNSFLGWATATVLAWSSGYMQAVECFLNTQIHCVLDYSSQAQGKGGLRISPLGHQGQKDTCLCYLFNISEHNIATIKMVLIVNIPSEPNITISVFSLEIRKALTCLFRV